MPDLGSSLAGNPFADEGTATERQHEFEKERERVRIAHKLGTGKRPWWRKIFRRKA